MSVRSTCAGVIALSAVALASTSPARPAEYRFTTDFGGAYRGVVYDRDLDAVVVATANGVHLVPATSRVGGEASVRGVELEGIEPGARVMPCQAGRIVLGFKAGEDGFKILTVHRVTGELLARIVPQDPVPFTTVLVGGPGRTIATISERIADATARRLVWRWDTWSSRGEHLATWTTPPNIKAAFDPTGERLLLLFADRAELRDRKGKPAGVPTAGSFNKAALSDGARVLVLGEESDRRAIVVVADGTKRRIVAPSPVHGVDVAPDGRSLWAWFQGGVVRSIDLRRSVLRAPVPLPAVSDDASVSSFVAENGGTALVGLATRSRGTGPYNGGEVARINDNRAIWHEAFPTESPTAFLPAAIAAGPAVAVWNRERIAVMDARPARGSGTSR